MRQAVQAGGHRSDTWRQVVFKALIVLHTMMRNGSTDNVLSYLSQAEVLHLRNVSAGNWEGRSSYYLAPDGHHR